MAADLIFIDNPAALTTTSDMRSTLERQYEDTPNRFEHDVFEQDRPWPRTTDLWCMHCCHPFTTMPVPLISRYDHERCKPVGFGIFCSPQCGRAYAIEHKPLSWSRVMIYYSLVLRNSFGIDPEDCQRPAWPRARLRVFGGDLSIEEFRAGFKTPTVQRVETVSFCMQNTTVVDISSDQLTGVSVGNLEAQAVPNDLLGALASSVINKYRKEVDSSAHIRLPEEDNIADVALETDESKGGEETTVKSRTVSPGG
jgi:hypothetical protein